MRALVAPSAFINTYRCHLSIKSKWPKHFFHHALHGRKVRRHLSFHNISERRNHILWAPYTGADELWRCRCGHCGCFRIDLKTDRQKGKQKMVQSLPPHLQSSGKPFVRWHLFCFKLESFNFPFMSIHEENVLLFQKVGLSPRIHFKRHSSKHV